MASKVAFKYIKNQRQKPITRSGNMIWFNPPFSKTVFTIVAKYFFDRSRGFFKGLTDYIKTLSETQLRLVTALCKIYPKNTNGMIVRLQLDRVTIWHYVTVE